MTEEMVSEVDLTVSMPARNSAQYIRESIESVLRQDDVSLEIIVVDDGSTDGTGDVVRRIDDPRITLIRNERQRGIGYCHNAVLARARAPFVTHVDSDDVVRRGGLARMVKALREHPEVGQAYAYFTPVDERGRITPQEFRRWRRWLTAHRRPGANHRRDLLLYGMVANHLRTYRRSLLEDIGGFDEVVPVSADYSMALCIADRAELLLVPRFLYCYRRHSGNTWQTGRWRGLRDWRRRIGVCRGLMKSGRVRFLSERPARAYGLLAVSLLYDLDVPARVKRLLGGRSAAREGPRPI